MKSIYYPPINHLTKSVLAPCTIVVLLLLCSCDDFVNIDPPRTDLIRSTVFESDATANSAMLDVYYQLTVPTEFSSGSTSSISFITSLSSDEQLNYFAPTPQVSLAYQQFNNNTLTANNTYIHGLWSSLYKCIYKANAILEGISTPGGVSEKLKSQLTGEAKFIRAFCHFYLVNIWGDIPLVVSTDYQVNSNIPRAASEVVYLQIIDDLIDAQRLLPADYSFANHQRVRVNKGAATALLARAYLYHQDWEKAEITASEVINHSSLYKLAPNLAEVFRATSQEAIFQLWSNSTPADRNTFFVSSSGPSNGALRKEFVSTFEPGDQRWSTWGRSRVVSGVTYYYAFKYASFGTTPPLDFSTVMRLAEQYLIRSEARANLHNIAGAQADLNILRSRAGLPNTLAHDKTSLLSAVEQERKSELFTEWGHRWFDLKRTHRVDAVLTPIKLQWVPTASLYAIPESEMINNAALQNAQNPGY